ncbi:inhibitor I9 domain-containing protein [Chloropicon primus]|uniref:Inhibitor I9 domain-containing protein n=1 Tax=Chloropicon primus TaxID=1764295 RepID=A0A5B8MFW5_9CHLO|nr:hypothetical protein A3770_02p18310 [Chloropicon primus]UPQ98522.1 inhibitor I9 domain-containing protein [Chloropicon primus]|eukprot:QDZ19313.1 hypothetical protein A3770_02p18310 [Chloropicon primus]
MFFVTSRRRLACAAVAVIAICSCLASANAYPSSFFCTLGNERMKLDVDDYDLPEAASYIVGVKDVGDKPGLLGELEETFDGWKPRYEYATMSMFSGSLSPQQVSWLLGDDRVAYVECDGFVKMARRKKSDKEL